MVRDFAEKPFAMRPGLAEAWKRRLRTPRVPAKWRRRGGIAFAVVAASLLVATAVAPAVLSTAAGEPAVTAVVSRVIPGRVEAGDLSLTWFGDQSARDVRLLTSGGERVATVRRLASGATLWDLLFGADLDLGRTSLEGVDVTLRRTASGRTNVEEALGLGGEPRAEKDEARVALDLILHNGAVRVHRESGPSLRLSGLTGVVGREKTGAVRGRLVGSVSLDGDTGAFAVAVRRPPSASDPGSVIRVWARHLPTRLVGALTGAGDRLVSAVGDELRVAATAEDVAFGRGALPTEGAVDLRVRAPRASATLRAAVEGGALVVEKGGRASLTVRPQLASAYLPGELRPTASVRVDVELGAFQVPTEKLHPAEIACRARFTTEPVDVTAEALERPIEAVSLSGRIRTEDLGEGLSVDLRARYRHRGRAGRIELSQGKLHRVVSEAGELFPDPPRPTGRLRVEELPTAVVDRLVAAGGGVPAVVGRTVGIALRSERATGRSRNLSVRVEGSRIRGDVSLRWDGGLTLRRPTTLSWMVHPDAVARATGPESRFRLARPTMAHVHLERFVTRPAGSAGALFRLGETEVDGSVRVDRAVVERVGAKGAVRVTELTAELAGAPLTKLTGSIRARLDGSRGSTTRAVAGSDGLVVTGEATAHLGRKGVEEAEGRLSAAGDGMSLRLPFRLGPETLRLTRPATASVTLPPRLLRTAGLRNLGPTLEQPVPIDLRLAECRIPRSGAGLADVRVRAVARVDRVTLGDVRGVGEVTLQDLRAEVRYAGPSDEVKATLKGRAAPEGGHPATPLRVAVSASGVAADAAARSPATFDAEVEVPRVPTAWVDAHAELNGRLEALVGRSVGGTLRFRRGGRSAPLHVAVDADGPRMGVEATGKATTERVTLTEPATAHLRVGPEAYARWVDPVDLASAEREVRLLPFLAAERQHPGRLILTDHARVDVKIEELSCPRAEDASGGLTLGSLTADASVRIPRLSLVDETSSAEAVWRDIEVSLEARPLGKRVSAEATGRVVRLPDPPDGRRSRRATPGPIDLRATLKNLPIGASDSTEPPRVSVEGTVAALPVSALTVGRHPRTREKVAAVTGPVAGGRLDVDLKGLTGTVDADLRGTHFAADLSARLTGNALRLRKAHRVSVDITPPLSAHVLRNVHPLLASAVRSEKPVTLAIPAEHGGERLTIPLAPFRVRAVEIPRATIRFGKLLVENRGPVSRLFDLFSRLGTRLDVNKIANVRKELLGVRVDPIQLNMRGGIIGYEPWSATFLGPALKVTLDGQTEWVNRQGELLPSHRRPHLDMRISVGTDAFHALRLPWVGNTFMLRLPVTGPSWNPRIDWLGALKRTPQGVFQGALAPFKSLLKQMAEESDGE